MWVSGHQKQKPHGLPRPPAMPHRTIRRNVAQESQEATSLQASERATHGFRSYRENGGLKLIVNQHVRYLYTNIYINYMNVNI